MRLSTPATLLALAATVVVGCGRTPKVDNPVLGPPPPRVSFDDSHTESGAFDGVAYVNDPLDPAAGSAPGDYVRPVSLTDDDSKNVVANAAPGINHSRVIARVNGEPILEGDVMEPFAKFFVDNAGRMSAAQAEQAKMQVIKRDLDSHIDRKLLNQALREQLKAEQLEQIEARLRESFDEYADEMMAKAGVETRYELRQKLEAEGQSFDSLERAFVNQQLGLVYVSQEIQKEQRIGRTDLFAYYEQHRDEDYLVEERVKWQRIQIKFRKHGGKAEAFARLEKAVDELRKQRDFADVARDWSDGTRAKKGGYWDWTRRGELKNEEVEAALFKLELNVPSRIFVDDESYQIVRVLERENRRYVPFEEVQEEIRAAVERDFRGKESERVVGELRKRAEITSILDDEPLVDDVKLPFQ